MNLESSLGQKSASAVIASSNPRFLKAILGSLESRGWFSEAAHSGADALAKVESSGCQALVLDRWLPDLEVHELIKIVKSQNPNVDIFLMDSSTGEPVVSRDVPRYASTRQLLQILQDPEEARTEVQDPDPIPEPVEVAPAQPAVQPLPGMMGTSSVMGQVYRMVRRVAFRDTAVLLTGETGTGKELVARAVHGLSRRSSNPFIIVNCAAIPEALLESELFGYVRGAFTGAVQSRVGRIHAAQGGTLFLDEIGELPPSMQAKLLRFLQEGEVQRLGSSDLFRVDVRVVAATNSNLTEAVRAGKFRLDLFYRLSVFPIELPPLQERADDILLLAEDFLFNLCRDAQVPPMKISPAAGRLLRHYSWPGNVRELQHVIERAFILADSEFVLQPDHFSSVSHR